MWDCFACLRRQVAEAPRNDKAGFMKTILITGGAGFIRLRQSLGGQVGLILNNL